MPVQKGSDYDGDIVDIRDVQNGKDNRPDKRHLERWRRNVLGYHNYGNPASRRWREWQEKKTDDSVRFSLGPIQRPPRRAFFKRVLLSQLTNATNINLTVGSPLCVRRRPYGRDRVELQFWDEDVYPPVMVGITNGRRVPEEIKFALIASVQRARGNNQTLDGGGGDDGAGGGSPKEQQQQRNAVVEVEVDMALDRRIPIRYIPRLQRLESSQYNQIGISRSSLDAIANDDEVAEVCKNPALRELVLWIVMHREPVLAIESLRLRDSSFFNFTQRLLRIISPNTPPIYDLWRQNPFTNMSKEEKAYNYVLPSGTGFDLIERAEDIMLPRGHIFHKQYRSEAEQRALQKRQKYDHGSFNINARGRRIGEEDLLQQNKQSISSVIDCASHAGSKAENIRQNNLLTANHASTSTGIVTRGVENSHFNESRSNEGKEERYRRSCLLPSPPPGEDLEERMSEDSVEGCLTMEMGIPPPPFSLNDMPWTIARDDGLELHCRNGSKGIITSGHNLQQQHPYEHAFKYNPFDDDDIYNVANDEYLGTASSEVDDGCEPGGLHHLHTKERHNYEIRNASIVDVSLKH